MIKFSQNILEDIRPRAMTRDIDWGIPIPLDGWRDNPTKRLYVWFDAVIGYLSASDRVGPAHGDDPEAWRQWWNDPEALSYYFMGKDNITFHSQIWPAELLAYAGKGDKGGSPRAYGELNLPTEVVSSEFLTMEGKKFSSSKRVVIYVRDLLSRYQPDAFRYFVAAAGPENQDSDFTWAEFVRRTNDELVAGWGNLVNRTATLINKNFGEIPPAGPLTADDQALLDHVGGVVRHRRRPDRPAPAEGRDRRGDAGRRRGQQVRLRPRALEAEGRGRARAARHDPARHRAVRRRPEPGPLAVPAVLGERHRRASSAAPATSQPMPRARRGRRPRRGSGLPDPHRRLHRRRPLGASPDRVGTPVAKPTPVFTKLDPGVVDEELARLGSCPSGVRQDVRMTPADVPAGVLRQQKLTLMVNRYEIRAAGPDGQPGRADGRGPAEADGVQGAGHLLRRRAAHPPVFSFKARQAIDLNAGYDVYDENGEAIGFFRKDFGKSLLRSTFHLNGPHLNAIGQERNQAIAILRRFVDFPFSFHFDFTDQGEPVLHVDRQFSCATSTPSRARPAPGLPAGGRDDRGAGRPDVALMALYPQARRLRRARLRSARGRPAAGDPGREEVARALVEPREHGGRRGDRRRRCPLPADRPTGAYRRSCTCTAAVSSSTASTCTTLPSTARRSGMPSCPSTRPPEHRFPAAPDEQRGRVATGLGLGPRPAAGARRQRRRQPGAGDRTAKPAAFALPRALPVPRPERVVRLLRRRRSSRPRPPGTGSSTPHTSTWPTPTWRRCSATGSAPATTSWSPPSTTRCATRASTLAGSPRQACRSSAPATSARCTASGGTSTPSTQPSR